MRFQDGLTRKQQVLASELAQSQRSRSSIPIICIAEADPWEFLASLMAASALFPAILLITNPGWGEGEWQQLWKIVKPDVILGRLPLGSQPPANAVKYPAPDVAPSDQLRSLSMQESLICIPTGGTTGELRFAIHTLSTLSAAVRGFQQHFQQQTIHSCCVLPLYHVSGLMQFLRSHLTGGNFWLLPWQTLLKDSSLEIPQGKFWLSLVPTQLQRLLAENSGFLHLFQGIFIGGGPTWPSLLQQARNQKIPLALTYGMTETAAQVATLQPQEFLSGHESCGKSLPHVQITLEPSQSLCSQTSHPLGQLRIQGDSLALGYLSTRGYEPLPASGLLTDDIGYWDQVGHLHVVGRNSSKIITGGENVFPAEVEAVIYSTGLVQEVCVLGIPDPEWGEMVVAVYVPHKTACSPSEIQVAIAGQLSRYKQPKHWMPVQVLPRTPQGKINQQELRSLLSKHPPG